MSDDTGPNQIVPTQRESLARIRGDGEHTHPLTDGQSFLPLPAPTPEPALPAAAKLLEITLQRIGWEIRQLDIDVVAGRVVVELHRFDGRWLYLVTDSLGRTSLNRFHRDIKHVTYRGLPSERLHDEFLGRSHCEGFRSGLRKLTTYVAENPAPGFQAIEAKDVRRALALLMNP